MVRAIPNDYSKYAYQWLYIKMKKIWGYINDTIMQFRTCFSRDVAFDWFMIVIVGLIARSDHLGVTSIIRGLMLDPVQYNNLIHFFRSEAWKLEDIQRKWTMIVKSSGAIFRVFGMPILIGDGVKVSKEAFRMPGVKKIHQESQDSSKSEYIRGQLFGGLGTLIGSAVKQFCLPLSMTIHDGNGAILDWKKSEYKDDSHVTRLVREACKAAKGLGEVCWLLMDAYFLTGPALIAIEEEARKAGKKLVVLIARAKSSYTAWWTQDGSNDELFNKEGKPKESASFKIMDLFKTKSESFIETMLTIYGEREKVRYLCVNLLWGRGLYQEIRFVLVYLDGAMTILACTDLTMDPCKIIELYCYRFKIETFFRAFKQVLAGFSYHFWTRRMPYFKPFIKAKEMSEIVADVTADVVKDSIINTYDAIEGFVMFACIAMGLIQLCAVFFSKNINKNESRWLRTYSSSIPSEETTVMSLRYALPFIVGKCDELALVKAIRSRRIVYAGNQKTDSKAEKSA